MIKNDIKYICKRIIIGFGILLLFSFVNRCNVKALSDTWYNAKTVDWSYYNPGYNNGSVYTFIIGGNSYVIEYKSDGIYVNDNLCRRNSNSSKNNSWIIGKHSNGNVSIYILPSYGSFFTKYTNFTSMENFPVTVNNISTNSTKKYASDCLFSNGKYVSNDIISYSGPYTGYLLTDSSFTVYGTNKAFQLNNSDWSGGVYSSDFDSIHYEIPSIVSLQPTKITKNDVIIGYSFKPKFDIFNVDSYSYQYKFSNSYWLNLTENEQLFRVNNNGTIYVRIKDKSNNEVVASQTFTISNISKFDTKQNYNINFSGEYRTENYLNNNNSSKSQSIIQEYQIYVDYIPKSSILKYQYQYVKDGDSLDNNNWQNVATSDNGSLTYVATDNGTLYARILDSSDNILYSSTFTVNSIGLLAYDSNEKVVDNFITKISNKINYGGPVSSLFLVPINLLNSLYEPISNSESCSPLQLGSLLGINLSLPCVNVKKYLGNSVYNIIDLIMSFFLILGIIKMCINIYNKFISMKDISS